jgi:hypothetical protein
MPLYQWRRKPKVYSRVATMITTGRGQQQTQLDSGDRYQSSIPRPITRRQHNINHQTLPLAAEFSMSSAAGTIRGTPNRGQGRGQVPFTNSPSAVPRPNNEPAGGHSEAGGSTVSASRQKQSKRDEV